MTLRTRLLLALLALAFLPTFVFTLFTLDQLNRAIDRWHRPGVERALESGLEVGKSSLARIEVLLTSEADEWAGHWSGASGATGRPALALGVRDAGLDFAQVYRRGPDGTFRLTDQIVPPGVLATSRVDLAAELAHGLPVDPVIRSPLGVLAGVAAAPDGDLIVAGIWVHPEFFSELQSLSEGAVHYRQLDVYVDLQRRAYFILVAAIAVLLALIAWFLSQTIARETARPITTLSQALERVAGGDLATRVQPAGALELRSLGTSFNAMAERLESARDAVQQAEREAAWRDVARKLAHEFKNILTPMQLSLQLVEAQIESLADPTREGFRRPLASALREVDHLNRLAGQVSQYARLPEPHLETLDLAELTRTVIESDREGPVVAFDAPHPVCVRGDRLLLTRAIHNLVLNAREAEPAHGPVEIALTDDGVGIRLDVMDRGPGLPADLQPRLFEPYVSTKRRGSGLGLSLVRDIVLQHGGTITLENRDGGGARAILTLPRSPGAGAGEELERT